MKTRHFNYNNISVFRYLTYVYIQLVKIFRIIFSFLITKWQTKWYFNCINISFNLFDLYIQSVIRRMSFELYFLFTSLTSLKLKDNSALFFRLHRDDLVFFIGTTVAVVPKPNAVMRSGGVRLYEVAARRSARRCRLTDDLFQWKVASGASFARPWSTAHLTSHTCSLFLSFSPLLVLRTHPAPTHYKAP